MNKNMLRHSGIIALALTALLLVVSWGSSALANDANGNDVKINHDIQVDVALLAELDENGRADYLIYFSQKADLSPAYEMDWHERGHFVMNTLRQTAEISQKNVRAYLDSADVAYRHFWIDNIIAVESGDLATLNGLMGFAEIGRIQLAVDMFLVEPEETSAAQLANSILAPEPNLVQIKATDTWALGIRGEGTVIANIDTGVRHTHQALVNQYRGHLGGGTFDHNFNWLDPDGGTTVPTDANGHGTHVMGTMVGYDGGANEIGVAPESEWIACRGCLTTSCPQTALLACAEWIAAPYAIGDPGSADPDMRPMAVNNSWGNCQQSYNDWYQGAVDAWHAAGVFPVFANGNSSNCGYSSPPGLNTVGNPARYGNVTGVGSSGTSNGMYAPHSNWGPTDNPDTVNPQPGWEDLKPQVIAPGVNIRSSLNSGDAAYGSAGWTGTSMSAPHVAGMVALMWQAAPCLIGDYATTETIIEMTATPIYYDDLGTGARWPNYATGWGEINVLAAVQEAQAMCGPTGTIEGTVTADGTGDPLANVNILATLNVTTTRSATTNAAGEYEINFAPEGTYEMTASVFGYLPQTVTDVEVISGTVTVQNFVLQQAPSHEVSGVVTDGTTGWPLYARIQVGGADVPPIWTDPADGSYSIILPEGITYTFTVDAWVDGYETYGREVGPLTSDQTENFGLQADLASCSAPGYSLSYLYFEDFQADDGGYTLEQTGTNPAPWQWGAPVTWPAECPAGTNCWGTNLTGNYNNNAGESLTSPVIDLSGVAPGEQLTARWYQANHIETFTWDKAYAEVSIDGGSWTIMWQNPGATVAEGWRELTYDITAAAGNNVQFRWRFTSDGSVNHPGLYVDRVAIAAGTACEPAEGGLVVGNVYDDNTGAPLVGALVASDDDSMATAATPDDPNVDDGFYTIFAAEGDSDVTASMSGGYADQTASLTIVDGTTSMQNFWLTAGWLVADPDEVTVTLATDSSFTLPLALSNEGAETTDYSLNVNLLYEDFEGSFPPAGWDVIDNGGNCVWQRNDEWPRPNYAGGDGFSAAADSDACGSGTTMNTELHTPVIDLSGTTTATLEFVASYRHLGSSSFRVHVSDDGGSSWDTLLTWSASVDPTGPGALVSLDLSPYAGSNEVIVSFHYTAPGWHWWAQIDQVRLIVDAADWLDVSQTAGNLDGGETDLIDLTFDSTGLSTGSYSAVLSIFNDTPYGTQTVPVTLNVVETADYGLELSPTTAAGSGDRGEMVPHSLTITNTGSVIDTYTLSASGHSWDVDHPASVIVDAGQSATVMVWVTVPNDAAFGATDTVVVTATSDGDPSQSASATLTTTAEWELMFLYLPIIVNQ